MQAAKTEEIATGLRVHLQYPIIRDGVECSHLDVRRPAWRDMKQAIKKKDEAEQTELLVCALADISVDELERVSFPDFVRLGETVGKLSSL